MGVGASAQQSDTPVDVEEGGAGNIRSALGHQHTGNPGGWEDTTGGASAQNPGTPVMDFGPSPSPNWQAESPAARPAAVPAAMAAAAAEAQPTLVDVVMADEPTTGGKGGGASAQEPPAALGIFQPRIALPNNFAGESQLVDGYFHHGATTIPPVLPRLPPDAVNRKHVLTWLPVKDTPSLQTQQRRARLAGPESGLDPGYVPKGGRGCFTSGKGKGGEGGCYQSGKGKGGEDWKGKGKDKGKGGDWGFGPGKGKGGKGGKQMKGKRTRHIGRRGGRRSRSPSPASSAGSDRASVRSASEASEDEPRPIAQAMVNQVQRTGQRLQIHVVQERAGASAQAESRLCNGGYGRRSEEIPGGLGPDPGFEVVVERYEDHLVLRFTQALPQLRGDWTFEAERPFPLDMEERAFGPVDIGELMAGSRADFHRRCFGSTAIIFWVDGEKIHGPKRAQDCMPVFWPSICLRSVLRDVDRSTVERRCSGYNIRVMQGLVRSRAFEPVIQHILSQLWPRIWTYLDMLEQCERDGRLHEEGNRIVPPRYTITCRAGRHRSVGITLILSAWLRALGFRPYILFRSFGSRPSCGCPTDCVNHQSGIAEECEAMPEHALRRINSAARAMMLARGER
ncbi:MAG: hypothetical protein GY772_27860 [bacterium]|nr:hypothetical protein [bacterium]